MKGPSFTARLATILLVASTGALFLLDVLAPGGVAEGNGYPVALLLGLWVPGRRTLAATALVMVALVIAGAFIGPRLSLPDEIFNRGLAIGTIAATYAILSSRTLLAKALGLRIGQLKPRD